VRPKFVQVTELAGAGISQDTQIRNFNTKLSRDSMSVGVFVMVVEIIVVIRNLSSYGARPIF